MAMCYRLTLVLGDSPPSVWLVLILGVSTPRMIISNRMYYLSPVMHSTTLRRRMSKTFHMQVDRGPASNLYRGQVPNPRAKFISAVRVAGRSHLADAVCLSSLCSQTADRKGSYCVEQFMQVYKNLVRSYPPQCNNDEKSCYSSADINCGETT